ncbi:hypothetical protein CEXT_208121 [Caerostris extrusa]|uniref:Uncharacterized protein n=1 Tax=Caerostris extrusa TaxID=172846 RepID=A0AAV4WHY4_CAEEX|nr:hypothetical protein CEXT_208121 [Caerostris extrusa]
MHNLDSSFHPSWEEMGPQKPNVIKKTSLIQSPCCSKRERERERLAGIQCIVDLEGMFDGKSPCCSHRKRERDGLDGIQSWIGSGRLMERWGYFYSELILRWIVY